MLRTILLRISKIRPVKFICKKMNVCQMLDAELEFVEHDESFKFYGKDDKFITW